MCISTASTTSVGWLLRLHVWLLNYANVSVFLLALGSSLDSTTTTRDDRANRTTDEHIDKHDGEFVCRREGWVGCRPSRDRISDEPGVYRTNHTLYMNYQSTHNFVVVVVVLGGVVGTVVHRMSHDNGQRQRWLRLVFFDLFILLTSRGVLLHTTIYAARRTCAQ